ncbi:MAG TPA: mandelate racemase/muconate lactonizing enzyme family protein [Candidatus Limnocylindrales bacterium]|nr:mandelate racemase/muconate lactonizing enzyme family protein [Candidatus Limnocylindrales bacterium]
MKISAIATYPLILPIREIYGGAAGFLEDCRTLIIRVETDNGIEGWGEATQGRPGNTYEILETMDIMVRKYFAPPLVGLNLEDTGTVIAKFHAARYGHPIAKAGLEIAVYDALAKFYKVPLYRLLGGPFRKEIELVGGLGMDLTAETIGTKARQLREQGYRAFKLKIGHRDMTKDVARVRAVREAVGDDATIRVDGNASYSFLHAREILNALSQFRLADAEQPLARGDLKNLAELRRSVGVPIAAQESVSSAEDALALLEAGAADLLKIKLTHIGGFQRALQVAAVVGAKSLPVVVGQGSACTPLLSAAEMHLHASLANAQPGGEMTGFLRLSDQEIFTRIPVTRGKVVLTDAAGLGIEVNLERLAQAAITVN